MPGWGRKRKKNAAFVSPTLRVESGVDKSDKSEHMGTGFERENHPATMNIYAWDHTKIPSTSVDVPCEPRLQHTLLCMHLHSATCTSILFSLLLMYTSCGTLTSKSTIQSQKPFEIFYGGSSRLTAFRHFQVSAPLSAVDSQQQYCTLTRCIPSRPPEYLPREIPHLFPWLE